MRTFIGALFVAALVAFVPPGEAQKPKREYARGRVAPANLAALKHAAFKRHGYMARRLPKVTATKWDCRDLGQVPPIVDQGDCGSCWDFSGTSVVTSALIKAGYGKADGTFALSEQYTLDCYSNGGCSGDDNTTVLAHAKSIGLPLSKDYGPYSAHSGRCKSDSSMKLYQIKDWGFCSPNQDGMADTQDIKNMMVAYGPIGAAIAADGSFMNVGPDQVFDRTTSRGIDHDIVLVGWDDSKGSKGAWLLRNSWGTSWANGGYCMTGDTKVSLLNGNERTLKELADGAEGDSFWVYSCDKSGNIVPGRAHSARKTRPDADLIKVALDNGETIRCTPDHPFMLRDGTYRDAGKLQEGDSLMPLYRNTGTTKTALKGYERVYVPGIRRWKYTHREIAGFVAGGRYGADRKSVV